MPEMPLLDEDGRPLNPLDTFLLVQGLMAWPKDLASAISYRALGNDGQPPLSELFKKTTLRLFKTKTGGTIAGQVFFRLLQLKLHRPEDASVGKAVFVISRLLETLPPNDSGRAPPIDRDYVHKFWAEFRPAAHLWGAAYWLSQVGISPEKDRQQYFYRLLHTADAMLKTARAVGLAFDPDPWTLPGTYPRLSIEVGMSAPTPEVVKVGMPAPMPEVIEILKQYRAPVRT